MASPLPPGLSPALRLKRLAAIAAGALVILLAALVIADDLSKRSERILVRQIEARSRALAVALGEALRREFDGLFEPGAQPAAGANAGRLDAEIRRIVERTQVIKLVLYAGDGLILYSTDPAEVGTREHESEGLEAALHGEEVAAIELEEEVSAFSGLLTDLPVVETYVPLLAEGTRGAQIGALEIYADVGEEAAHITGTFRLVLAELLAVGLSLYALACAALWWLADRREQVRRAELETARLELEARAARAEAQHKANLLASVSHELRTPLNAVIGYAGFMLEEPFGPLGDKRYQEYAAGIQSSGRHLSGLVDSLLDLSSLDAGLVRLAPRRLDVAALLDEGAATLGPQAWRGRVELAVAPERRPLVAEADETALRQILHNLVGNAVKFSRPGGRVEVAAALDGGDETAPTSLRLTVRDQGPGIDEATIARVGDPFLRLRDPRVAGAEGIGLGLAIVQRLVALQGGALAFESGRTTGAGGTSVTVTLPTPPRLAPEAAASAADMRAAG